MWRSIWMKVVIWYVALESKIQREVESIFETLNPNEIGSLPEYSQSTSTCWFLQAI